MLPLVRKIIRWIKRWALSLKFGIILLTLLAVYTLTKTKTRDSGNCLNEYETEPTADVLSTRPFVKDQPKLVILLSYQRSGSTFVGEWFNTNPDVFYNFEPVDSLYSAMYGTPQNSNVPSDITNYPNGSIRILPKEELSAVSTFLRQFLLCDLESLPTQSLLSFYFIVSYNHIATKDFNICIRSKLLLRYDECDPFLIDICGSRFGEAPEEWQSECLKRLWWKQENPYASSNITMKFKGYQLCMEPIRREFKSKCQHLLQDSCHNRSTRVMKTVRATMESMEPLLETLPNFRVIHLVRDPRAVALSRKQFDGYVRGIFSGNDTDTLWKEAKLFCSTVVRDIKTRLELERKYPGRIYALNFDKMITTNTTLYMENVYRFLDATPHKNTVTWQLTKGNMNSANKTTEHIAKQWQDLITFKENKQILESCKEFYDLVKFNWAT